MNQFILFSLLLFFCLGGQTADAAVRVRMSQQIDPAAEIVVETKIRHSGIHNSHSNMIGSDLLKAGKSVDHSVLKVMPLLFEAVYATAFHPAYYIDSSSSDRIPYPLRTVQLSLQPRSWTELLKSGEPLREGGGGITAGAVNDHFYYLLRYFLPAFDRAGGTENLCRHLPLLEELAAFAHHPKALQNSQLSMRRFSNRAPEKYAAAAIKTEKRYRLQLTEKLNEIKAWLCLTQEERLPMYDWLKNLHSAEYVFDQIMDDSDRRKLFRLLEQSEQPGHPSAVFWQNPKSKIEYNFTLGTRIHNREETGFRTSLTIDLQPRIGLENTDKYRKKSYSNFIKATSNRWQLQRK